MRTRELDGFDTVGRFERRIAMRLQQVVEELHVQLVVFDNQDRLHDAAFGSRHGETEKPRFRMLAAVLDFTLACEPLTKGKPNPRLTARGLFR